jgi:hypothetical protein
MQGNKLILKDNLMRQMKSYRNISLKTGLALWSITFGCHYAFISIDADPMSFMITETLFESLKFSAIFAVIGFCSGSIIGAKLQRDGLSRTMSAREKRKEILEEQISLRQSKLDQFSAVINNA